MKPVALSELVESSGIRFSADFGSNPVIHWISADTRKLGQNALFVCMPSANRDTHALIPDAAAAGAVACVVHGPEGVTLARENGLAVVGLVNEGQAFNFALGRLCSTFFGDPSGDMSVIGITGTNGKTTTAWMIRNALVEMGVKAAYLGTLGLQMTGDMVTLENTTPFPVELWQHLHEVRTLGCEVMVMEASSHALYQRRLAGVSFDIGVFTNLTQDHLDFHGSMDSYESAKKLLFTEYAAASTKDFAACMNLADEATTRWLPDLPCPVFTFGTADSMLKTSGEDVQVDGLTLTTDEGASARLKFGGNYNVANATAALSALMALGYEANEALDALAKVAPVPGRFEPVPNHLGIGVLVDYAHTPDALINLLQSVKDLRPGRIITVFGCGGDRDRNKRPKMADAVSSLTDLSIVTSDNPRTEDPEAILDDILPGLKPGASYERIVDRRDAITRAITVANPGDVVVIAGKGHEDYQIIGREKIHMSDQEMARDALLAREGATV